MSINLSISDLFASFFGYESDAFEFDQVTGDINDLNRKEFGDYGTGYYRDDDFGREYFLPVTMTFPDKDNIVRSLLTGDVNLMKSWDLPWPVVSMNMSKTIVRTPMTERAGSVIELAQMDAYEINVKGLLIAKTDEFPEDMMKQLKDLFVVGTSVQLRCAYTDIWLNDAGYNVVLVSCQLPEVRGVKNVFGYELRFVSDGIVDLVEIGN